MPRVQIRNLRQVAILWPPGETDEFGDETLGTPEEIMVRWTWTRRESVNAQGQPVAIDAQVAVNQDVAIGSQMVLAPHGTRLGHALSWWYGTGSAGPGDEVMFVVSKKDATDLKNRATRRELNLSRFMDTQPAPEGG